MAVRTPSDKKGGPADRWRTPTLADRARRAQSAQAPAPISSHLAHEPESEESTTSTPADEEMILLQVPRKFLPFVNPEFIMSQQNQNATATAATATPKTGDQLRAEVTHHREQMQAAQEQLAHLEANPVPAAVAAANTNGKRNVAKTVGKVAGAVGVTGLLVLGGYYAFRTFRK